MIQNKLDLSRLSDRELLEGIYTMLIHVYNKINDDNEQLAINVMADLLGSMITTTGYGQERIQEKNVGS